MNEPTITCPNCHTEIKLNESLAAPLIAATRKQFEQQLAQNQRQNEIQTRRDNLIDELEQQLSQQVTVLPLLACEWEIV